MATKYLHDDVLDGMLEITASSANAKLTVCKGDPDTYAKANATSRLAEVSLSSAADMTVGDDGVTGRQMTVAEQADIPIIGSTGSAEAVCIVDTVGSRLLVKTTCTKQALTKGGTVTVPVWYHKVSNTPT